jgi:hypothetical protein
MYVHSQTQQRIFALLATNFGHYSHHQFNVIKIVLEGWLHVVHTNVKLCGIPFTLMSVFINSLEIINGVNNFKAVNKY